MLLLSLFRVPRIHLSFTYLVYIRRPQLEEQGRLFPEFPLLLLPLLLPLRLVRNLLSFRIFLACNLYGFHLRLRFHLPQVLCGMSLFLLCVANELQFLLRFYTQQLCICNFSSDSTILLLPKVRLICNL
ncbi:hypothetical protein AQUCO_11000014v1 [Aquilegia coerulea]|uniref:Uncharacterized protein n=1 Tax=Aquilegia coerulea TaxID=218851 RepID=A0A2G5C2W4_AQUCA|nr:hypothetical protein AQUCO_11000014v1 [Aquilegia coerulea]